MARPRGFDEERALDAAMHTFWVNGYAATSTQELCEATGLGRSTIYNTFTSKHELFVRSLARYIDAKTAAQSAVLGEESVPPLERVRRLLESIVADDEATRRDGRGIGCLVVNSTLEVADRDPESAAMLDAHLRQRLVSLRAVIALGQSEGTIAAGRDAESLAQFVNSVIGGLRIAGSSGADRSVLESIAATALDALRP